jgi:AraC-like DNA-binding protein
MTEVLFVEVLRSWIKSLGPGEGGWLGAMADPHIGPALQLIHERPDKPWSLRDLGRRVGLGRSAFSSRFTKLVGQPMRRYMIARRMEAAASLLESSDEGIAAIATRVGYETASAFSKLFHRLEGLSPGRYRAAQKSDDG